MASKEEHLDRVFHALSDKTRRAILEKLTRSESNVTDIAEPFDMSLNAISKHLKVLEKAGLINRTREGRIHRCAMNYEPLEPALDLISYYKSFWENQLDSLEEYLNQSMKGEKNVK